MALNNRNHHVVGPVLTDHPVGHKYMVSRNKCYSGGRLNYV